MFLLLVLSFLGSYVNIPIWQFPPHPVGSAGVLSFYYGMLHVVPIVRNWPGTIIAVNVCGAAIPTFLSMYLLAKNRLYRQALLGVVIVTTCVHLMAEPVRGVGIAVPTYIPPLIAAAVGLLLSRRHAPPLAYISGSMGTLIGADLLNLGKVQGLGASRCFHRRRRDVRRHFPDGDTFRPFGRSCLERQGRFGPQIRKLMPVAWLARRSSA